MQQLPHSQYHSKKSTITTRWLESPVPSQPVQVPVNPFIGQAAPTPFVNPQDILVTDQAQAAPPVTVVEEMKSYKLRRKEQAEIGCHNIPSRFGLSIVWTWRIQV